MITRSGTVFSILLGLVSLPALAKPTIVEFDPDGSIETSVSTNSIDKKGNIAGSYCCDGQSGVEAGFIRHPNGTYTTVGPSDYDVFGIALAAGGLATGAIETGGAFIDDSKGHITKFAPPGESDEMGTFPRDISADGTVFGYFGATDGLWHGFVRDNAGNFTLFDAPKAGTDGTSEKAGTFVSAASDTGEIVGWSVDDSLVAHAYLRSPNGKFKMLNLSKGQKSSHAYSVNKRGTVGGSYIDVNGITHGFLLDKKGNVTVVDIKDATYLQISGVNDHSDATGYYQGSDQVQHSFVRSANGDVATFDAPDAGGTDGRGTIAQSINNKGVVAGYYWGSTGFSHGFVRKP